MPKAANPLQTTNRQTPTSAQPLPDRLNALLASGDSPIIGPETARTLAAYAETPEPPLATKEQVEVMISKLAMATAQPRTTEAEAGARLELYWLALNDIPVTDLREAFTALIRGKTFLPVPAEVRTAAIRAGSRRQYLKSRARYLAWKHRQEWRPECEPITGAEIAALIPNLDAGRNAA